MIEILGPVDGKAGIEGDEYFYFKDPSCTVIVVPENSPIRHRYPGEGAIEIPVRVIVDRRPVIGDYKTEE